MASLYLLPDELLGVVSACLANRSEYCLFEDGTRALRCACVWTRAVLPKPAHKCESLVEVVSGLKRMTLPHPRFDHAPRLKQRWRCAPSDHEPYMLIDTRVLLKAHNMCVTCYCRRNAITREAFEHVDDVVKQASRTRVPSLQVATWVEFNNFNQALYWSKLCFQAKTPIATSVAGGTKFTWVDSNALNSTSSIFDRRQVCFRCI